MLYAMRIGERSTERSTTEQNRNNKKFRQSSWWMFNGISCCFYILVLIFLPEIYSIHRSLHITFNSIRLHDHQLPKKINIFSSSFSAQQKSKQKTKIIKEAMHAFYFILCAERTSDQDENFFCFVVKPAFFSSLFLFHSLRMYELVTRR